MTGLEKIIDQILAEAKKTADEIIAAANSQADAILADAKEQGGGRDPEKSRVRCGEL